MKAIIRSLWFAARETLHRWMLRQLRELIWRADEWVHVQEVRLRDEAAMANTKTEIDPIASNARERVIVAARRKQKTSKLRYVGGEFIRTA
jgi:hypothetical protein